MPPASWYGPTPTGYPSKVPRLKGDCVERPELADGCYSLISFYSEWSAILALEICFRQLLIDAGTNADWNLLRLSGIR